MVNKVVSEGTYGGFNPQSTNDERTEPRNSRPNDMLNEALKQFVKPDIGPYVTSKTFRIEHPLTRGTDITFERFYPLLHLLVQTFARRRTYEHLNDEVFEADLERYRTWAEDNGYLFLAVIDGDVERDDLMRIHTEVAA